MLKRKELVDWFKANKRYKLNFESVEKTSFEDVAFTRLVMITPTKMMLFLPFFYASYTLDSLRIEGQDIVNGLGSLRLFGSNLTK